MTLNEILYENRKLKSLCSPWVESFFFFFFFFSLHNKAGLTNKRERNTHMKGLRLAVSMQDLTISGPFPQQQLPWQGVFLPFFAFVFLWKRLSAECYPWASSSLLLDYVSSTLAFLCVFRYCYHFEDQKESSVVFYWKESFRFFYHEWATKLKCTFALNKQRN